MRHYNKKVRKDGVIGLKELLKENPYLIRQNLCTLIENLGPLFNDIEEEILKSTWTVWELIFSNIDSKSLSPYFPLIAAYLNCSMTHLNLQVKKLSLKIFKLLLKWHGDLLRSSSSSSSFHLIRSFLSTLP